MGVFTGAAFIRYVSFSQKSRLENTSISAADQYSVFGGPQPKLQVWRKCDLLKFRFSLALVFPHIHLYCLGWSLGMGTYRKRYYQINKCVRGEYLSLFFGTAISLDAKKDKQSR